MVHRHIPGKILTLGDGLTNVQLCLTESLGTEESDLLERKTTAGKPLMRSGLTVGSVHRQVWVLSGQYPSVSAMRHAQKMHEGKRKHKTGTGLVCHLLSLSFYAALIQASTALLGFSGWKEGA